MEVSSNFNHIVARPLTEETKEDWFKWVKDYLISQDLWEVISTSAKPDENDVEEYDRWRRKNAAALHVMRISCGPHNLHYIREDLGARLAWGFLYYAYHKHLRSLPQEIVRRTEEIEMYDAISDNNWSAVRALIDRYPRFLDVDFGESIGETPLHVAARFGHVDIVEELVRLVAPEYLEIYDASGYTPLLIAAEQSGVIPIAECLRNKNSNVLAMPRGGGKKLLPVELAIFTGRKEMGRYLYSVTPKQLLIEDHNRCSSLFLPCLAYGELDIILDLLQQRKELLFAGHSNIAPIQWIAFLLPDPNEKSQLPFWKRWFYDC